MKPDAYLPDDPLERFREIYDALNAERSWWNDASSLRFSAVAALTCPGRPDKVAKTIRASAEDIKKESGWFGPLSPQLQFIVGTMLVLHGDNARDFLDEVKRVRDLFRAAGLEHFSIICAGFADDSSAMMAGEPRHEAVFDGFAGAGGCRVRCA